MTMSKEIADGFRQVAADQITQDIENSSKFATKASLATVATSGSYNDLTDKPDSSVTRLVHTVTGITLSAGTAYTVADHTVGENRLTVYLDGLQYTDFSETSRTSIVFDVDIPATMSIVVTTNNL